MEPGAPCRYTSGRPSSAPHSAHANCRPSDTVKRSTTRTHCPIRRDIASAERQMASSGIDGEQEADVLAKVVVDALGHSSATITADLYSHTTEPSTRDASDRVAAVMFHS